MMIYLVGIVISLTLLHIWIRYRRFGRLINAIPGPSALPLFGNILAFNIPTKKIWIKLHALQQTLPILRLLTVFSAKIITRDPDDVKVLLSCRNNINKDVSGYSNIKCCGNNGIVVSGGKFWEHRRKILNQAFTPNILEIYSETLYKRAQKFTKDHRSRNKVAVYDVLQMFMKFAFEVVCEATMDFDIDSVVEEKGRQFRNAFIEVGEICYYRVARPYITDWMMKFIPLGRRQEKLWEILRDFAGKVIDDRRKYHASMGHEVFREYFDRVESGTELGDGKVQKKNLSVLDVLLLNEQKGLIDNQGILDETILMIAAGFETTGVAIMFLALMLAENKEAQDIARKEIVDVVGGYNNLMTMEHIKDLEYLERCAKESLRLFTTTPYIARSIDKEVQLGKSGQYTIPLGTEAYISLFDLHRNPDYWQDPLKFDPDRFLPENIKKQHPFAYAPFSKGPRSCIGQKLGMKEMKTIVAHILYNFYLEPIDRSADFEFDLGVTLQVEKARVRFTRIDNEY